MSIFRCPSCSGLVSDNAIMCPHCGYDIQKKLADVKKEREELRGVFDAVKKSSDDPTVNKICDIVNKCIY